MSKYVSLNNTHKHSHTHTRTHTLRATCTCLAALVWGWGWKMLLYVWLNVFSRRFLIVRLQGNPKTANFQKQTSYFANWAESAYPLTALTTTPSPPSNPCNTRDPLPTVVPLVTPLCFPGLQQSRHRRQRQRRTVEKTNEFPIIHGNYLNNRIFECHQRFFENFKLP